MSIPSRELPIAFGNKANLSYLFSYFQSLTIVFSNIENIPTTIDGMTSLEQLQIARNELITFPSSLCNIFPFNLDADRPETGIFNIANNNICATNCAEVGNNTSCTPACYWESRITYRIPFGTTDKAWHDWQTQDCDACAPHQMQIEAYCADTSHYNILQRFIDINPNSDFNGINISPGYFENQITLHYFGHQG